MWSATRGFWAWRDHIVPVAVERVAREVDRGQLSVGNLDAFWVFVFVQFGTYFEAGIGCRRGDQLDDGAVTAQRFSAPVDGDERKQPMLYLVPFAGAGRQVANRNRELELVRELLKL